MISIDDLLKVILVMSVAFAIVGLSYELMKLIHKAVQIMEDLRRPINNASELTDYVLEDYVDARSLVREGAANLASARRFLEDPTLVIGGVWKVVSKLMKMSGRKA